MKGSVRVVTVVVAGLAASPGWPLGEGQVRMPLSAYQDLKERAQQRQEEQVQQAGEQEAGEEGALAPRVLSAELLGTLDGKSLSLEVRVTVDGVAEGWHVLPVLPSSVGLLDAAITGGGTLLGRDGMRTLAFRGPGRRTLVAHLVAPGEESGGMRELELNALPGVSRRLQLELAPKVDAEVEPSDLVASVRDKGKRWLQGHVPSSAESIRLRWSVTGARADEDLDEPPPAPTDARGKEPPRINVQTSMLVSVGERLLTVYSTLRYAIFHAPVSRFEFTVPAGAEVTGVQGRGVTDWTCPAGDGERTCSVDLPFPVQRAYELSVQLERALPKDTRRVEVPAPEPKGVQRGGGHVAVEVMGNAEVKAAEGTTAIPEDVRELPPDLFAGQATPILLAFKFLEAPVKVALLVARRESVEMSPISIDDAAFTTVWTTEGHTITEGTLAVRNRQRQFLALGLPAGAVIQSAFVDGDPVKPSTGEDGRIRVPLRSTGRTQDQESFTVQVVFIQDGLPLPSLGSLDVLLPTLDSEVGALHHTLVLPDQQHLWAFGGDLSATPPRTFREDDSRRGGFLLGAASREAPGAYAESNAPPPPLPQVAMDDPKVARQEARRDRAVRRKPAAMANVAPMSGGAGDSDGEEDGAWAPSTPPPVGQTGVMPVRIQIPQSGVRRQVHAYYVPPGKPLAWHARVASSGVHGVLELMAVALGLALGWLLWRQWRPLWRRERLGREGVALAVCAGLAVLLALYARRTGLWVPASVLPGMAGAWGMAWFRARKERVG
jgi:hypothetical protein